MTAERNDGHSFGRHPGENRGPLKFVESTALDTGFRRYDGAKAMTDNLAIVTPVKTRVHIKPAKSTALDTGFRRYDGAKAMTDKLAIVTPVKTRVHIKPAKSTALDTGFLRYDDTSRAFRMITQPGSRG